jgi:CMP-N,N'-diacetyllegionaminic acid synthase
MIDGLSTLAIIPARGGSKGLPGKNVIDFCGKPLIAWTIEAAKDSRYVDRVVVSTDDPKIAAVSRQYGADVPFERPPHLASDTASSYDVVLHVLDQLSDYDLILLLQPTSPLRTAVHIDEALELLVSRAADNCISVVAVSENPHWMVVLDDQLRIKKFLATEAPVQRRQDLPPLYLPNGAIYISRKTVLKTSGTLIHDGAVAYPMAASVSIDIDDKYDLQAAKIFKLETESVCSGTNS